MHLCCNQPANSEAFVRVNEQLNRTPHLKRVAVSLPQAYSKSPGLCSHDSGVFWQMVSGQETLLLCSLISC